MQMRLNYTIRGNRPACVRVVPCRRRADFQKSLLLPAREPPPRPRHRMFVVYACWFTRERLIYVLREPRTARICSQYMHCNCRCSWCVRIILFYFQCHHHVMYIMCVRFVNYRFPYIYIYLSHVRFRLRNVCTRAQYYIFD